MTTKSRVATKAIANTTLAVATFFLGLSAVAAAAAPNADQHCRALRFFHRYFVAKLVVPN